MHRATPIWRQCAKCQQIIIKRSDKITWFQRRANRVNTLRQWRKRFNFERMQVDAQVPWNDILICYNYISREMVVMNETNNTTRRTTITWHSAYRPYHSVFDRCSKARTIWGEPIIRLFYSIDNLASVPNRHSVELARQRISTFYA